MTAHLQRFYNFQSFEPGKIASAFRNVFLNFGLDETKIHVSVSYHILDEGNENREANLDEIGSICELGDNPNSVYASFSEPFHFFSLSRLDNFLYLDVQAPTAEAANRIFNIFEGELTFVRAYPKIGVEDHAENRSLNCFLSYRFNLRSNKYASELIKFLGLIGTGVTTGNSYEPRRVSDKVLSHLDKPLDFVIYLIVKEGGSTWMRDEVAVSLGKGYHIIPLVEKGCALETGILGDLEYIPFSSGHISDTFISILEAIEFINKKKESSQVSGA